MTISRFLVRFVSMAAVVAYAMVVGGVGWHLTRGETAVANEMSSKPSFATRPVSPLRMGPAKTGVIAVDNALLGFLSGDIEAAVSQLVVHQVHCGTLPWDGMPALACSGQESQGTLHALALTGCEPVWVTAAAAREELQSLLADSPGLQAVTRVGVGYSAALAWPGVREGSLVLAISAEGVTSYRSGCGVPTQGKPGRELTLVTLGVQ